MVSFITSRLNKPAWWDAETFTKAMAAIKEALPRYYEAKVAADEVLYRESLARGDGFAGICLRPGTLTDKPSSGKAALGKLPVASGDVSRETVARVAEQLLAEQEVKSCWLDLLDGDEEIAAAVGRVVRDGVDCAEGEPCALV